MRAYWGDETQGARRKYYRVTPNGAIELDEAKERWVARAPHHRQAAEAERRRPMNELRMYVEHLFEGRVLTAEMIELKEEIYGNLVARYEDYVAGGMGRSRGARAGKGEHHEHRRCACG